MSNESNDQLRLFIERIERLSDRGDELAHPSEYPFELPDGTEIMVPKGVQPGFGYNPGTAHLRVLASKAVASVRSAIDQGLVGAAGSTIQEIANDPALLQFMAVPEARFPIAILPEPMRASIGGQHRLVVIPFGVMDKQMGRGRRRPAEEGKSYTRGSSSGHPDLLAEQYRLLPSMFDDPVAVGKIPGAANSLQVLFSHRGEHFRVVIRQDGGQSLPKIVTYHRVTEAMLRSLTAQLVPT